MFLLGIVFTVFVQMVAIGKGMNEPSTYLNDEFLDSQVISSDDLKCRFSDNIYKAPLDFRYYACSACYNYMHESLFEKGQKLYSNETFPYLWNLTSDMGILPNASDTSSPIRETFASSNIANMWIQCCEASVKCCETMRGTPKVSAGAYCPRTWDGWGCWPDTPNNTVAEIECPTYVYHHGEVPVCTHFAIKNCTSDGTWYINNWNHEWSNYTLCSQKEDIMALQQMHVISFGVSIALLLPAVLIFICYKQLHVIRVAMHRNLFISLMLNAVFVIVFETYYMNEHLTNYTEVTRLEGNSAQCKIFYCLTKYLRLSNYMWMLCEGLYLHKLITAAFAEQKNILKFYIIGWGLPIIPVAIWATIRQITPESDNKCWTMPFGEYEWIMYVPMLLTLVANFAFLTNILRVIIMKLTSIRTSESTQFKRAVRATVALIPLFGLHFFLILYHPKTDSCTLTKIYRFLTYATDGLQGAVVAVLFCYLNQEVINLIMRSYKRRKLVRSVGSSHNTSNRKMINRDSRLSISTNAVLMSDSMSLKRTSK